MDPWVWLVLALVILIIIAVVFVLIRRKQRSGGILAVAGRGTNRRDNSGQSDSGTREARS